MITNETKTATCELCGGTGLRGGAGEQRCSCGAVPPSSHILDLLDQYWNIAYQQGIEGRSHDNEAGDAQRVLSEITAALALLPGEPKPRGIPFMGKDRVQGMVRGIDQYRNGVPEKIVEGSPAQVLYALKDARHDVLVLWDKLVAVASEPVASPAPLPVAVKIVVTDNIVRTAMQDAWNDICDDTGCHPLDIQQLGRKRIAFSPSHWANAVAEGIRSALSQQEESRG